MFNIKFNEKAPAHFSRLVFANNQELNFTSRYGGDFPWLISSGWGKSLNCLDVTSLSHLAVQTLSSNNRENSIDSRSIHSRAIEVPRSLDIAHNDFNEISMPIASTSLDMIVKINDFAQYLKRNGLAANGFDVTERMATLRLNDIFNGINELNEE
ncbi:uncharacterized protein ASCRUDRAFT_5940 [Ascoidea rubescens DSM 1968]|uniref:Uncharacterized protein n=1 Tax=Ascoidea rubescens DSM 1968 TaxID=1344418 RepID=A0A1D2VR35_9ASCO|nr:hypothetical protein ASCRUDRAFT_5940 [Ascoidea rubescens DSM 1968]ODV64060.1 hypothetical protein ASCRUDRAFT_5940 [Ascoidea rubescens DSM 1968]